ncbi:uncharacterized protein [Diadema antillarum]|uniref:uncharacterized protein n=1 Tax=Diadema antillarum TaxID=105358 RepID=UPI003A8494E1
MIGVISTNGLLAPVFIILSVFISRLLTLDAFQLRHFSNRQYQQDMNRYKGEVDSPPSIQRPPPGFSMLDLIQLVQNDRIAFSPMPANQKPKVPDLPPPKRSAALTKERRARTRYSKRACNEVSRWEAIEEARNFHNEVVDVYKGQWFWVTHCADDSGHVTTEARECLDYPQTATSKATCHETKAWVLAYSRLKNASVAFAWDYIAVSNCCSCKIESKIGGELVIT